MYYVFLLILIFILFIIIALIYSYQWFFVGLIVVIVFGKTIYKIIKSHREEIEQQEREKEREKRNREEKEERLRKEEALTQAINEGKDVCKNCETINPNRCARCHECISCWSNRSSRYDHLCKRCGQGVAARECAYAESHGKDVCWECLTVEPLRCRYCGNCTICYGLAGGEECQSCDDDD